MEFPALPVCNASISCENNECCSAADSCGFDSVSCGYGCKNGPCFYNSSAVTNNPPRSILTSTPPWIGSPASLPTSSTFNESLASSPVHSYNGQTHLVITICVSLGSIIFLVAVLLLVWCFRRRMSSRRGNGLVEASLVRVISQKGSFKSTMERGMPNQFLLHEILAMTRNFSSAEKIGEGGFGEVFSAMGPVGEKWAVKRCKNRHFESQRRFEQEVLLIQRMNHRNLVSLIGWCNEGNERILVYDYVPNRDLSFWIHGDSERKPKALTLPQRLRIATSAARGLSYLHDQIVTGTCIHCDVKSSNILLDHSMEATVADFGLSKLMPNNPESYMFTKCVGGTRGYIDPEYATSHKLTAAIDVFSFGVVLLELLTGRKPMFPCFDSSGSSPGQQLTTLTDWVQPKLQTGSILEVIDPSLDGVTYDMKAILEFAQLAGQCIKATSNGRPSMSEVYLRLEAIYRTVVPTSPPIFDVAEVVHSHQETPSSSFYQDV